MLSLDQRLQVSSPGDADPRKLVLEMEEISQLRAVLPEQVRGGVSSC